MDAFPCEGEDEEKLLQQFTEEEQGVTTGGG